MQPKTTKHQPQCISLKGSTFHLLVASAGLGPRHCSLIFLLDGDEAEFWYELTVCETTAGYPTLATTHVNQPQQPLALLI